LHNSYFLTEAGLFFSSEALGLVFSATYLWGSFTPSALPPDLWIGRPAGSPTDKLRKDSALTPVTSEKSILFSWVTKIVRLCKGLEVCAGWIEFRFSGKVIDKDIGIYKDRGAIFKIGKEHKGARCF